MQFFFSLLGRACFCSTFPTQSMPTAVLLGVWKKPLNTSFRRWSSTLTCPPYVSSRCVACRFCEYRFCSIFMCFLAVSQYFFSFQRPSKLKHKKYQKRHSISSASKMFKISFSSFWINIFFLEENNGEFKHEREVMFWSGEKTTRGTAKENNGQAAHVVSAVPPLDGWSGS